MRYFQRVLKMTSLIAISAFEIAIASQYEVVPLVSNLPNVAPNTDPNLVNPWGLFFNPNGAFWVADNGSNLSTLYQADGSIVNFVINVASAPTGTLRNSSSTCFFIGSGDSRGAASFLFASEDGTILGFKSSVDPVNAIVAADSSASGAVFKGLEVGSTCCEGDCLLFATDFHNARISQFDKNFQLLRLINDPTIPSGYGPFNIRNLNGFLYVTYAKQLPPENKDDEAGLGNGYVDVFTKSGVFVKRLISQGNLNSPWGLALAPNNFGDFSGALLVGNFGDGLINAYDPNTGAFLGQLSDINGNPIQIDGLWALGFSPQGTLYFTSGPDGEQNGLVGMITLQ